MDIDWTRIFTHLISVTVAYVLALPVAWDVRKKSEVLDCGSVVGSLEVCG
jgi:hypothetical protein